jgi:hypothetical protein
MTLQIPNGYCNIQALFTDHAGHQGLNAVGYVLTAAVDQTDADAASDALAPSYKAILSTGSTFDGVRIYDMEGGALLKWESISSAGAGGRGGDFTSPQVQHVIKKSVSPVGRKFRGHLWVPDVRETDVAPNGTLGDTIVDELTTLGIAWLGLASASATFGAGHLLHSSATPPTVINSMTGERKVGTLRNRYDR